MNIKIARTMLILCAIYLVGFYILKFIFPEKLLLVITDSNILAFGEFIESRMTFLHIYQVASSFLTFYLFVCASRGRFTLRWYEALYILAGVVICKAVNMFAQEFYVRTSTCTMFILAWLCKGKFAYATISFAIHGFFSQFLFSIRGFDTIIYIINIASGFVLSLEIFTWLIILSLLFYLWENKNGRNMSTISTQGSKGLQS